MTELPAPDWPAALRLLDEVAARDLGAPVAQRQVKNTLREVFVVDERYTLKRYTLPATARFYRRPWRREHAALKRVGGRGCPRTLAVRSSVSAGQRTVIHLRTYLPGEPVSELTTDDMAPLAALFATFHRAAVTTDDALLPNFLRLPDGQMGFIDLGRAKTFRRRGPGFLIAVAREWSKLLRESLRWDAGLWKSFRAHYDPQCGLGPIRLRLAGLAFRATVALRRARKGGRD